MRIFRDTNIPFMKYKWLCDRRSPLVVDRSPRSLLISCSGPGFKFGIDFVGGTQRHRQVPGASPTWAGIRERARGARHRAP